MRGTFQKPISEDIFSLGDLMDRTINRLRFTSFSLVIKVTLYKNFSSFV